jgi:hypothetical protein
MTSREQRLAALEQRIGAPDSTVELLLRFIRGSDAEAAAVAEVLAERGCRVYLDDRSLA